jgi:hypothetical protein
VVPQIRSGGGGEQEKKSNCPCRELNPSRLVRSLVTVLTELLRLPTELIPVRFVLQVYTGICRTNLILVHMDHIKSVLCNTFRPNFFIYIF